MADSNIIPTQTPNSIVIPPLNIPPRLSVDTSRPTPNRYDTVVSVEFSIYEEVRHIKWFSDIQMAWIWIRAQVDRSDSRDEWDVAPFLQTADAMDRQWTQGYGDDGFMVADDDGYEYIAYYEPTLHYEDVRDREEHF